jgi:sterol desaturase/sphingolipid hydroxylase (fatty acid hydroxylase superfamily)
LADHGIDDADMRTILTEPRHPALTYGTYPVLLAATLLVAAATIHLDWSIGPVVGALAVATIAVCFVVERITPLRPEWQMTKDSLVSRDLPFIGLAMLIEQILQVLAQLIAVRTISPDGFGLVARLPLLVQVVFALLATDLLWYGYHRAAHTWIPLWRYHSVHHAPSQLYVLVHQVFHPLDLFVSRFVVSILVMKFSGITPDAAFMAILVINLQQTVSHMNSDQRVGWLNYLLIGTETHRYHHSATDRGNYGSVVPLWDQVFGTFVYEPTAVPDRLGLDDPDNYPDPRRFHATLVWPFWAHHRG